MLAMVLVILVIFVFLRNVSATHHSQPGAAHFGGGHVRGDVAVGLYARQPVADGAHAGRRIRGGRRHRGSGNIVRHMEMGKTRMQAALEGAREIGFTILSMTLSLAAVFIPVLFMGGIIGRLFHEFAVTIMAAILISGFVSLSLTPMLCSRFLKPPTEKHNALFRASEKIFDGLRAMCTAGLCAAWSGTVSSC